MRQEKEGRICKTIHQYSKGTIPEADMKALESIAYDCMQVRNYVYQKYGGIKGLYKIYPGYAVDTEMTACGLRERLNLPSVYYSRAVFDALGDIKTQWAQVKNGIYAAMNANDRFTPEDKHYLRFVIKVSGCFANILNGREAEIGKAMLPKYREVAEAASGGNAAHMKSLNNYLCRQVRKRLKKLHSKKQECFSVKNRGYRYGESGGRFGIFLAAKERYQRLFIPLTDKNAYDRVITVRLFPEKRRLEITVPLFVKRKEHGDYTNEIGVSPGLWNMLTTDGGRVYGSDFGRIQKELSDYRIASAQTYKREQENNPGRKKANARKEKLRRTLETYVNRELNRMIAAEKPGVIYIPRLPRNPRMAKQRNGGAYFLKTWRKGYVEERLRWKCRENSIRIIEVMGKGIGTECSECGAKGYCEENRFRCGACGYETERKTNTARNVLKRGRNGQWINETYPTS